MKDIKNFYKDIKVILFDLDGTIYLGDKLIGDMKNTLSHLREKGVKVVFVSNNSSRTPDEYEEKYKNIGIFDERDFSYSSLDCALNYLQKNEKGKKVYAFANEKVKNIY